jgi:DUF1365 family protein
MVNPTLKIGQVYHERFEPFSHKFFYKIFYINFNIDQLHTLRSSIFSIGKINLFSLDLKDYIDDTQNGLKEKLDCLLKNVNISLEQSDSISLSTMPRVFGYGFNPVSFWYISDKNETLKTVVVEVNNTFGDKHFYILSDKLDVAKKILPKQFHVSPFFDIKGEYHFSFHAKKVVINYFNPESSTYFFKSTLSEVKSLPFTKKNLIILTIKFPFQSFAVVAKIHWQAALLFFKKATFYKRPEPLKPNITRDSGVTHES